MRRAVNAAAAWWLPSPAEANPVAALRERAGRSSALRRQGSISGPGRVEGGLKAQGACCRPEEKITLLVEHSMSLYVRILSYFGIGCCDVCVDRTYTSSTRTQPASLKGNRHKRDTNNYSRFEVVLAKCSRIFQSGRTAAAAVYTHTHTR